MRPRPGLCARERGLCHEPAALAGAREQARPAGLQSPASDKGALVGERVGRGPLGEGPAATSGAPRAWEGPQKGPARPGGCRVRAYGDAKGVAFSVGGTRPHPQSSFSCLVKISSDPKDHPVCLSVLQPLSPVKAPF